MRLLGLIGVACAGPLLLGMAPHSLAAPDIPDINSLIDDSGPLPCPERKATEWRANPPSPS
jgi:hypothetical protein